MTEQTEVAVIGSGMAGLTVACLLAKQQIPVRVLEQNWLPGGCSSSYPRKHYIFESGATTLVGLDPGMPLHHLLEETGISLAARKLEIPMRVYLKNGAVLTRHQDLDAWIAEAERVFGPEGQRPFWEYCSRISQFVWDTSLQQRAFPPSSAGDLLHAALHFRPRQIGFAALAFRSVKDLLADFGLLQNREFVEFVDEQLLITAQNHHAEVNVLFGATALCYTQSGNYYMPGGLIHLVQPLVNYISAQGGSVELRNGVTRIEETQGGYLLHSQKHTLFARTVVSAIPANNTFDLISNPRLRQKIKGKLMASEKLNSAFQMGIVFKRTKDPDCLHHQIHLPTPLPYTGSHSVFLSLSHPEDHARCGPDETVASVSTHVPDPAACKITDKAEIEEVVLEQLEKQGFLNRKDILFRHSSTPGAWQKWTGRSFGFVGGYPQYMSIKPWQMLDARLQKGHFYLCGDSTYPGQGIPGACLSGIVAFEKMKIDGVMR